MAEAGVDRVQGKIVEKYKLLLWVV